MAQESAATSSADGISWDLRDLYLGVADPQIDHDLGDALLRAEAFEAKYRGRVNVEGGPATALLLQALQEVESIYEQMDRPAVFAQLLHASKTDEPSHGALLTRTREQRLAINKHL